MPSLQENLASRPEIDTSLYLESLEALIPKAEALRDAVILGDSKGVSASLLDYYNSHLEQRLPCKENTPDVLLPARDAASRLFNATSGFDNIASLADVFLNEMKEVQKLFSGNTA